MPIAKLTKRNIDSLAPRDKNYIVYDTELKGFGVRVHTSGRISYLIEYRPSGGGRAVNKKKMTFGRVGEFSPHEARKIASDHLAYVRKGGDPLADKQATRKEATVRELVDLWEAEDPPGRKSGRPMDRLTRKYMLARLRNHIVPLVGKKRLSEISTKVVNDTISQIIRGVTATESAPKNVRGGSPVRGGSGAARKVASDLSIVIGYAIERNMMNVNPVKGARIPRAGKRYGHLSIGEMARIFDALNELENKGVHPSAVAILRLLILTGARPGEIERLRWEEIDFPNRCLRLSESKTGYSARPLSTAAMEILSQIEESQRSPFVFPATQGDGHYTGAKKVWNQARELAGLPHKVRYHARHAFASYALSDGVDPASVAALMGHKSPRTTLSTYAHVVDETAAIAAEKVGIRISGAMTNPRNTRANGE